MTRVELPDADLIDAASTAVLFAEAAEVHAAKLHAHPSAFGADVRERLVFGLAISPAAYVEALAAAALIRIDLLSRLEDVDAIISPTVPIVAPLLADAARDLALPSRLVRFTRLANVTGLAALSLPVPRVDLPVGLQILARDDEHVFAAAAAVERRFASVVGI
jgi:aspartyl-tRNA(Asn)/glutamyl-tRNA(Gln) amidotransferase subunit A